MKRILLLLLVSSPIFSMQPKRINEIKQQEQSYLNDKIKTRRFLYTQMALAYTTMPSTIMTFVPKPLTMTYVAGNFAIVGAAMAADRYMQEQNNNK